MKKYLLALSALLLLLAGCASSVTKDIIVDAEADPKISFSGYTSYTWLGSAAIVFDPEGRWEPPRARGMVEDSVDPDLIVAFAAGIDMSSMEIDIDPESNLTTLENVPLGALTVILVDAKTGLAIWAGIATAEIQENPDQETIKKRLEYAVNSMFKKLPK
jgi:hypothetical protein